VLPAFISRAYLTGPPNRLGAGIEPGMKQAKKDNKNNDLHAPLGAACVQIGVLAAKNAYKMRTSYCC